MNATVLQDQVGTEAVIKNESEATLAITQRLKQETRTAHNQIEKVPGLARLFAPDYRLAEYRRLLMQLLGFYQMIEECLYRDLPADIEEIMSSRKKSPLLLQDLAYFDLHHKLINEIPPCQALPVVSTFIQKLGVFYVLEGSTLGGLVIRQRLLKHFGNGIENALHFYSGYGEQTAEQWRIFQNMLNQQCKSDSKTGDEIVAAANATFASLSNWLVQSDPMLFPLQQAV